jgi:hypothetical protein
MAKNQHLNYSKENKMAILQSIAKLSGLAALAMSILTPTAYAAGSVGPKISTLNKGVSEVNFRNVGVFQHNMLLSGDIQLTAKVGPLTVSDKGYGNDKLTVVLPAIPFSAAQPISVANPSSPEAALAAGRVWMTSMASVLTSRIQNWALSQGVSMGIYNYTQEVNIKTAAGVKKRALFWNISVDKDGKATYGEPKLVNPDPLIVEGTYVTSKAVAGLPSTWKFNQGGKIQYRVLDKKLNPITAWQTVDVNGAYDDTSLVPSDTQPNCLLDNRNAGCVTGYTDMRKILDDTGSDFAYINYVHGLSPEYDAGGNAKGAISVDQRVWRCGSYENEGYFGFVLNTTLSRYFLDPSLATPYKGAMLGAFRGKTISPSEYYKKVVPASMLPGHPDGYFISPMPGDDTLWSKNDPEKMRLVIYMAPVRNASDGRLLSPSTNSSDTTITNTYSAGSLKRYRIGTQCDNCFAGGDGTLFDRTATFHMTNPQEIERVAIVNAEYDDWMAVWVNGYLVLNRPNGGDRLNLIDTTYSEEYCPPEKGSCRWVTRGGKYVENYPGARNPVEYSISQKEPYHNVDIKPYLRPGQNTIFMRTIVGGWGEGIIDIETNECGGNLGLTHDFSNPPAGASFSGVSNTLVQKAQ